MNPNYETTLEATFDHLADAGLIAVVDVLASAGVAAQVVYDGDAAECPHCAWQALSAAA